MTYNKIKIVAVLAGKLENFEKYISDNQDSEIKHIRIRQSSDYVGLRFDEVKHAANWYEGIPNPLQLEQNTMLRLIKKENNGRK